MLPTAKHLLKMEARFYPAIWLGKDPSTNQNILGIRNNVVKARTITRQIKPDKYNKQMVDVINASPAKMTRTAAPSIAVMPQPAMKKQQETTSTETQTPQQPAATGQQPTTTPALTELPVATAPSTQQARAPLPMPTPGKREVSDDIAHGSSTKQARTEERATAASRRDTAQGPPTTRMRISAVTVTTEKGQKIEALSNEDEQEIKTEKILLEPWVTNIHQHRRSWQGASNRINRRNETRDQANEGTRSLHRSSHQPTHTRTCRKIIKPRWVLRQKGNTVRARIIAKGYTEEINDNDDMFSSTRIFCVLRTLLVLAQCHSWICLTGDISTAVLHAAAAAADLYMYPPAAEFYNAFEQIAWKLNKQTTDWEAVQKHGKTT